MGRADVKTISARSAYPAVLGRMNARLEQLWLRSDELEAAADRREALTVALSARLDDLAEDVRRLQAEVVSARHQEAAVGPVARSSPALDGCLGQGGRDQAATGPGVQSEPEGWIDELTDRLERLEERIGGLLARPEPIPPVPSSAMSGAAEALGRRLDELGGVLRAQGERLHHLEGRLPGEAGRSLGTPPGDLLGQRRLEALEGELEVLRQQAAGPSDGERRWIEERLRKVDRRVGTGLALVGLLAVTLAAAGWWWTSSSLEVVESRPTPVTPPAPAIVPPTAIAHALTALEQARAEADGFRKHTARLIALIERRSEAHAEAQQQMIQLLQSLPRGAEPGGSRGVLPADAEAPGAQRPASAGRTGVSTPGEGAGPPLEPDQRMRDPSEGDPVPTSVAGGDLAAPSPEGPRGSEVTSSDQEAIAEPPGTSPEALAEEESDLSEAAGGEALPAPEDDSGISPPQDGEPEIAPNAAEPPRPDGAGLDLGPEAGAGEDAAEASSPRVLTEERYVVQLIGFRTRGSVAEFSEEMGIRREARYLEMRFGGRPWYGVILGDYATEAEAEAAAEAMPRVLRDLDPWIRSIPAGSELLPIE